MILHGFVLTDKEEPDKTAKFLGTYSVTDWIRDLLQAITEHPDKVLVRTYTNEELKLKHYSALKNYRHNHRDCGLAVRTKDDVIYVYKEED